MHQGNLSEKLFFPTSLQEWLPISILDKTEQAETGGEDDWDIWFEHTSEAVSACGCKWAINMHTTPVPLRSSEMTDFEDMTCWVTVPNGETLLLDEHELFKTRSGRSTYQNDMETLIAIAELSNRDLKFHSKKCVFNIGYKAETTDIAVAVATKSKASKIESLSKYPIRECSHPVVRLSGVNDLMFAEISENSTSVDIGEAEIRTAFENGELFYMLQDTQDLETKSDSIAD